MLIPETGIHTVASEDVTGKKKEKKILSKKEKIKEKSTKTLGKTHLTES